MDGFSEFATMRLRGQAFWPQKSLGTRIARRAMSGTVETIFLALKKGAPRSEVGSALAVVGRGLEGDKNFLREGAALTHERASCEVTLIEAEALDALEHESGIALAAHEALRNLVTRGVRLNDLVGREFTVGEVVLRGIMLCDPCDHLERKTQPGVKAGLDNRGGLRAQIVGGGTIRAGDAVCCQIDDTSL
jgi:MOSC domain-containing protein YiiM